MKLVKQERMVNKGYSRPYSVIGQEKVVCNGRVMTKSAIQTVDPKEHFAKYNAEDFYLENIIAAGAVEGLKECKLFGGRLIETEKMDSEIAKMSSLMDENLVNNNVKNTDE